MEDDEKAAITDMKCTVEAELIGVCDLLRGLILAVHGLKDEKGEEGSALAALIGAILDKQLEAIEGLETT